MSATRYRDALTRAGFSWSAVWPGYLLAAFAALSVVLLMPGGPARAVVALPILIGVPGALTLGAVQARRFVDAAAFGGLAGMLSVSWLVFAALILNALDVRIAAVSLYACLLIICVVLAAVAQWRLLRQGSAASAADVLSATDSHGGLPRRGPWYAAVAVLAGAALLGGGAVAYAQGPHPAPVGYTWLAWIGERPVQVIKVGQSGLTLPVQIEHEQPGTETFRLTAGWSTATGKRHVLAQPLTVTAGPDATLTEHLTIPAPPGGCVYRVTVTMTEAGVARPRSWSVNADVQAAGKRAHGCVS